jgi:hypothetical protein
MREILPMLVPAIFLAMVPLFFIAMGMHSLVVKAKNVIEKRKQAVFASLATEEFLGPAEKENEDTMPINIIPVVTKIESDYLLEKETLAETFIRLHNIRNQREYSNQNV